jgi:hypothetical protein
VRARVVCSALVLVALVPAAPARAARSCSHAVVLTLPGVMWSDVGRAAPPALRAAIDDGASGSMSVRTIASRTSYSSGFATIGAGARVEGGTTTGGPLHAPRAALAERDVLVAGVAELRELAERAGYGAEPGALGSALEAPVIAVGNSDLGKPAPAAAGYGRWSLLAAMDASGRVDRAATGEQLIEAEPDAPYGARTDPEALGDAVDRALAVECSVVIVDQGDLARADQWAVAMGEPATSERDEALLASDGLLARIRSELGPADLLLVVSPTSPAWADEAHLGIAVAVGEEFSAGSTLESASTRRRGIVTLPDVAPTVLRHVGIDRPSAMNGRPFYSTSLGIDDPAQEGVDLDRESVFIDSMRGPLSGSFVVFQGVVFLLILSLLYPRERRGTVAGSAARPLEIAGLAVVAFPVTTYLAGVVRGHELGAAWFIVLIVGIDAVLVALTSLLGGKSLDRLLILTGFTLVVVASDLASGSRLQLNTVFGYSPIVAGRFTGAGNIVFAVLGVAAVMTGALIAHRWAGSRGVLVAVGLVFAGAVVVDGAPQFGSDVGGVLALVPAFGFTWLLLSDRRPTVKVMLVALVAAIAVLGLFLAIDLGRPPESQTHLARLFQDAQARGAQVIIDTVVRKATANLRVFRSTIWTYFVPPALLVMAYLLYRPSGRWERLAQTYPKLRSGFIGGLALALLGFAVNDSGIVIPAVILSFLVPMALLVHLAMEGEAG